MKLFLVAVLLSISQFLSAQFKYRTPLVKYFAWSRTSNKWIYAGSNDVNYLIVMNGKFTYIGNKMHEFYYSIGNSNKINRTDGLVEVETPSINSEDEKCTVNLLINTNTFQKVLRIKLSDIIYEYILIDAN